MIATFADSYYFLALYGDQDVGHKRAMEASEELTHEIVTTAWVLTEVADALADPAHRMRVVAYFSRLRDDPLVCIVPPTQGLFEQGLALYACRPDKEWSLTDCISFVVMKERGITDALTADHHFEQAGFRILL